MRCLAGAQPVVLAMFVVTAFGAALKSVPGARLKIEKSPPFQSVAHEGLAAGDSGASREDDIRSLLLSRARVVFCG